MANTKLPAWPEHFDRLAMSQGWSVFTCDDGVTRIQRLDDPTASEYWQEGDRRAPSFVSDEQAIAYVEAIAYNGEEHAKAALLLHGVKVGETRQTYLVAYDVKASYYYEVDATSEEEAIQKLRAERGDNGRDVRFDGDDSADSPIIEDSFRIAAD